MILMESRIRNDESIRKEGPVGDLGRKPRLSLVWGEDQHDDDVLDCLDPECGRHLHGLRVGRSHGGIAHPAGNVVRTTAE